MRSEDEFGNEADFYGGYSDDERQEDRDSSPHINNEASEAGPSKPRSGHKPRSKNHSILSYVKVEKSAKQNQPLDCER